MRCSQIVLFDAGGTLLELRGSVGEVYGALAREHGLSIDARDLDAAFAEAFRGQGPLAFGELAPPELDARERGWWFRVVEQVFHGRLSEAQLGLFFDALYELFRRPDPWRVFPDVRPALERLGSAGYRLGVVSNFDSRLDEVLSGLGIAGYFEHVVVSSRTGAAKPDAAIFRRALELFGVASASAWHVGDTPGEDVAGARSAGIRAVLLDRLGRYTDRDAPERVGSLTELCALVTGGSA
jgi:putative hydrolase of the HAD superfamily